MLVGMTRADGIDILSQGVKEGWTIEIVGSLQKMGLLFSIASHLGETRQRLCHTSHLASDVHVPHLIAIARTSTTLCLRSFAFDVSTIVQTVPHPQSHILGNEQGLGGSGFVIDIGGNVDESCQLLMHRIIWCPHPTVVIIGTIHLNQDAMLGRDGIQITVAILLVSLFIAVKVGPRALHLLQLFLRGEVACLPVATQLFIPYKGPLLTLAQSVDHLDDMLFEDGFLVWVLTTGKSKGQCRHIMARAVTLQLRCRRVPAVRFRIALDREAVGVAIIIELLFYRQTDKLVYIQVAIMRQPVLAIDAHHVQWQRLCLRYGGSIFFTLHCYLFPFHHPHLCRNGVAI